MSLRLHTVAEKYAIDCVLESSKQAVPNLDTFLGRLLTLSTALAGGGFLSADGKILGKGISFAFVICMAVCAATCLIGLRVREYLVDLEDMESVKSHHSRVIDTKYRCGEVASLLLCLGVVIGTAGLAARMIWPAEPQSVNQPTSLLASR